MEQASRSVMTGIRAFVLRLLHLISLFLWPSTLYCSSVLRLLLGYFDEKFQDYNLFHLDQEL